MVQAGPLPLRILLSNHSHAPPCDSSISLSSHRTPIGYRGRKRCHGARFLAVIPGQKPRKSRSGALARVTGASLMGNDHERLFLFRTDRKRWFDGRRTMLPVPIPPCRLLPVSAFALPRLCSGMGGRRTLPKQRATCGPGRSSDRSPGWLTVCGCTRRLRRQRPLS